MLSQTKQQVIELVQKINLMDQAITSSTNVNIAFKERSQKIHRDISNKKLVLLEELARLLGVYEIDKKVI